MYEEPTAPSPTSKKPKSSVLPLAAGTILTRLNVVWAFAPLTKMRIRLKAETEIPPADE